MTLATSQLPTSPSNAVAPRNVEARVVTAGTCHERSPIPRKLLALRNVLLKSTTRSVDLSWG